MYAWDSWHTLVPLVLGIAGLLGFVLWEALGADQPLIPLVIFNNLTISVSYLGCFLHGIILWSGIYYLPLYYEGTLGYSPVIAGVAMFPETFPIAPMSVIAGIVAAKTGRYRWALWTGWPISVLGLGILYPGRAAGRAGGRQPRLPAYLGGHDIVLPCAWPGCRRFAIGGVAFQNRIKTEFHSHSSWDARPTPLPRMRLAWCNISRVFRLRAPPRYLIAGLYADALSIVWVVMCGAAGFGLISSLLTKGYSMNQSFNSDQVLQSASTTDVESNVEFEKTCD